METINNVLRRRTQVFWPTTSVVVAFLLFQTPPDIAGFGQGMQIQANFGVYCNRRAGQRFPVHADAIRCGGLCPPKNDVRNLFAIRVNATSYFSENIQVSVLANRRGGFINNIRGFAIVAMTDDGRIVGGFAEHPDALIASCDPLMEGDTAFHVRASLNRRHVSLTWLPDSRNYGRVRFRAWIVVQHFDIYVLDSQFLENEVSGTDQFDVVDNFHTFILQVFNITRAAVTFVTDEDDENDDDQNIITTATTNNDKTVNNTVNNNSGRSVDAALTPLATGSVTSPSSSATSGVRGPSVSSAQRAGGDGSAVNVSGGENASGNSGRHGFLNPHLRRSGVFTALTTMSRAATIPREPDSSTATDAAITKTTTAAISTATTNTNAGSDDRKSAIDNIRDSATDDGTITTVTTTTISAATTNIGGDNMKNIIDDTSDSATDGTTTSSTRSTTNSTSSSSNTVKVFVALANNNSMELSIPTLAAFERAFQRRLVTTSYDVNAQDPFSEVKQEVPSFKALFPDRSSILPRSSTTPLAAPFAPTSGSPFFRAFGSRSSNTRPSPTTRIRQTFNRMFSNLGSQGGIPNQNSNPFGGNQFGTATNQFGTATNQFGNAANQFGARIPFNPNNQNSNAFGGTRFGFRNPFDPDSQNSNPFGGNQFGGVTNPFGQPVFNGGTSSGGNLFQQPNSNSGFAGNLNRFGQTQNNGGNFGISNTGNVFTGSNINTGGNAFRFPTNGNNGFTNGIGNGLIPNSQSPVQQVPGIGTAATPNGFGTNTRAGFPSAASLLGRFSQPSANQNSGSGFSLLPGFGQQNSGNAFGGQTSNPFGLQQALGPAQWNPFTQQQFPGNFRGNQFPRQQTGNQFPQQQFRGTFTGSQFPQPQFPGTFTGNQFPQSQFPGTSSGNPQFPGRAATPAGNLFPQQQPFPGTTSRNPFVGNAPGQFGTSVNNGVNFAGREGNRPALPPTNFNNPFSPAANRFSFAGAGTTNVFAGRGATASSSTSSPFFGGGLSAQLGSFTGSGPNGGGGFNGFPASRSSGGGLTFNPFASNLAGSNGGGAAFNSFRSG